MPLLGGLAIPFHRLGMILWGAQAFRVTEAEVGLGFGISLLHGGDAMGVRARVPEARRWSAGVVERGGLEILNRVYRLILPCPE